MHKPHQPYKPKRKTPTLLKTATLPKGKNKEISQKVKNSLNIFSKIVQN